MLRFVLAGLIVLAAPGGAGAEPIVLAQRFVTCETPNGERYQASDQCLAGDVIVTPCVLPDNSVRRVRSLRECEDLHGRFGYP